MKYILVLGTISIVLLIGAVMMILKYLECRDDYKQHSHVSKL